MLSMKSRDQTLMFLPPLLKCLLLVIFLWHSGGLCGVQVQVQVQVHHYVLKVLYILLLFSSHHL